MDRKEYGRYPIKLMTDKFGARGHDYRAPKCPLGICLIIASPFPDERTRVQALLRVGRHTDKCLRVQSTAVKTIDDKANIERKANIFKAVNAIKTPKKLSNTQNAPDSVCTSQVQEEVKSVDKE